MAKQRWFFATCSKGLEPVLLDELTALGVGSLRQDPGGVAFQGTAADGYRVCLWSRVGIRVFEELERGKVSNADDLYAMARRVPWERVVGGKQTFAITANVRNNPAFKQEHFAALKVKDALADHLTERAGSRPDVDTDDPDVPLRVVVHGRVATISRDLAGESLHRRGWRPAQHKSGLNEALAAGLIAMSGWDRRSPVIDPMCGSATLLVEAAHLAGDRAPGLRRTFAFERWTDRDRAAWDGLKADAEARWEAGRGNIPALAGNDVHPGAFALARKACEDAEVGGAIRLFNADAVAWRPPFTPAVVFSNPPWGLRLEEDAETAWASLGTFLKTRCAGAEAWVLSGEGSPTRSMRLKASRRIPVWAGPVECRWLRYTMTGGDPAPGGPSVSGEAG